MVRANSLCSIALVANHYGTVGRADCLRADVDAAPIFVALLMSAGAGM